MPLNSGVLTMSNSVTGRIDRIVPWKSGKGYFVFLEGQPDLKLTGYKGVPDQYQELRSNKEKVTLTYEVKGDWNEIKSVEKYGSLGDCETKSKERGTPKPGVGDALDQKVEALSSPTDGKLEPGTVKVVRLYNGSFYQFSQNDMDQYRDQYLSEMAKLEKQVSGLDVVYESTTHYLFEKSAPPFQYWLENKCWIMELAAMNKNGTKKNA